MPDAKNLDDRQLDAILERLDRLCDEVHALNRRFETAARASSESRTSSRR